MTDRVLDIAANLAVVRDRIAAAGGDPDAVRIVAVAKRFDAEVVAAALRAGLVDIGESYAQELLAVAAELPSRLGPDDPEPRWHFVGRVQRNKVRKVAPLVALWHSVDRVEVGAAIAAAAPGAAVLVQVNTTDEPQKGGCSASTARPLVAQLRELGLDVRGLMTIGPAGPPEAARPSFRALRVLADELGLAERSMGMTDDLEVAVQEGATIVRVGTALFGPRGAEPAVRH